MNSPLSKSCQVHSHLDDRGPLATPHNGPGGVAVGGITPLHLGWNYSDIILTWHLRGCNGRPGPELFPPGHVEPSLYIYLQSLVVSKYRNCIPWGSSSSAVHLYDLVVRYLLQAQTARSSSKMLTPDTDCTI
ncbi:hypothetical protein J6590_090479 [Homalodisca vitripennis]|nr:hypothetical protein J6590_090479 [Homalodisca vitripennis]